MELFEINLAHLFHVTTRVIVDVGVIKLSIAEYGTREMIASTVNDVYECGSFIQLILRLKCLREEYSSSRLETIRTYLLARCCRCPLIQKG